MVLGGWHIKRLGVTADGEVMIGVEGRREDIGHGTAGRRPWKSTAIRARVDARTLRTASGSVYKLTGPMSRPAEMSASFPANVIDAFADGFPPDWLSYLRPSVDAAAAAATQGSTAASAGTGSAAAAPAASALPEQAAAPGAAASRACLASASCPPIRSITAASLTATETATVPCGMLARDLLPPERAVEPSPACRSVVTDAEAVGVPRAVTLSGHGLAAYGNGRAPYSEQVLQDPSAMGIDAASAGVATDAAGVTERAEPMAAVEVVAEQLLDSSDDTAEQTALPGMDGLVTEEEEEEEEPAPPPKVAGSARKAARQLDARAGDRATAVKETAPAPQRKAPFTAEARRAAATAQKRKPARKATAPPTPPVEEAPAASSAAAAPKRKPAQKAAEDPAQPMEDVLAASSENAAAAAASSSSGKHPRGKAPAIPRKRGPAANKSPPAKSPKSKARVSGVEAASPPEVARSRAPASGGAGSSGAGEASASSAVRRSSSGRVTVKPLAYWANEVIARTYDGAFAADGSSVKLERRTAAVDFTGSFASTRNTASAPSEASQHAAPHAELPAYSRSPARASRSQPASARRAPPAKRSEAASPSPQPVQRKRIKKMAAAAMAEAAAGTREEQAVEAAPEVEAGQACGAATTPAAAGGAGGGGGVPAESLPVLGSQALSEYVASENERVDAVARKMGMTGQELVALNAPKYASMRVSSRLHKGTVLLVPTAALSAACASRVDRTQTVTSEGRWLVAGQPEGEEHAAAGRASRRGDAPAPATVAEVDMHEPSMSEAAGVDALAGERSELVGHFESPVGDDSTRSQTEQASHVASGGAVSVTAVALAVTGANGSGSRGVTARPKRARAGVARFDAQPARRLKANKSGDPGEVSAGGAAVALHQGISTVQADEGAPTGAPRGLDVGACVVSLKPGAYKDEIGRVESVSRAWVQVRIGDKLFPCRRKELKPAPAGLAQSSAGFKLALFESGPAASAASAPMGASGGRGDWTKSQVEKLKAAHFQTSPDLDEFWVHVARLVPGRSAQECSDKYYLMNPTPGRNKRKRAAAPADEARPGARAASHPDVLAASPWRGEAWRDGGEEEEEEEEGVLRNFSSTHRSEVPISQSLAAGACAVHLRSPSAPLRTLPSPIPATFHRRSLPPPCTQIGEYAQKVKQKQLKGRETAAVRARKLSTKGPARPRAGRGITATAAAPQGRAGAEPGCSEDEDDGEEESEGADEYFDEDGE
jgi:hypothetical protein